MPHSVVVVRADVGATPLVAESTADVCPRRLGKFCSRILGVRAMAARRMRRHCGQVVEAAVAVLSQQTLPLPSGGAFKPMGGRYSRQGNAGMHGPSGITQEHPNLRGGGRQHRRQGGSASLS